jgi:glycosyltransferase involved in cell wall biosynthesis
MRNALLISSIFPPQGGVGGLRVALFSKYLPSFGYTPYVITRSFTRRDPRYNEDMKLLDTLPPAQMLRIGFSSEDEVLYFRNRTIKGFLRDFMKPDFSAPGGLLSRAMSESEGFISSRKYDVVFCSTPDLWPLTLGAMISEKLNIPFVADFRDIAEQESGMKRSFRQHFQRYRLSRRRNLLLKRCDHVTTVSGFHQVVLQKKTGSRVSVIYNGFDPELFTPASGPVPAGPFRIVYAGKIINTWYQNPSILFTSVDNLISEGKINKEDITVEFYGTDEEILSGIISSLKHPSFIRFFPHVEYSEVPEILHNGQMMLSLTNLGRKGILTTKLFEYIGVRKPVLCVPGDHGEIDGLIKNNKLGFCVSTGEEMMELILRWINEWKEKKFPDRLDTVVEQFSRKTQTRHLAGIFDNLINAGTGIYKNNKH